MLPPIPSINFAYFPCSAQSKAYYLAKHFWPILYGNLLYKMGHDFLDIQYYNGPKLSSQWAKIVVCTILADTFRELFYHQITSIQFQSIIKLWEVGSFSFTLNLYF